MDEKIDDQIKQTFDNHLKIFNNEFSSFFNDVIDLMSKLQINQGSKQKLTDQIEDLEKDKNQKENKIKELTFSLNNMDLKLNKLNNENEKLKFDNDRQKHKINDLTDISEKMKINNNELKLKKDELLNSFKNIRDEKEANDLQTKSLESNINQIKIEQEEITNQHSKTKAEFEQTKIVLAGTKSNLKEVEFTSANLKSEVKIKTESQKLLEEKLFNNDSVIKSQTEQLGELKQSNEDIKKLLNEKITQAILNQRDTENVQIKIKDLEVTLQKINAENDKLMSVNNELNQKYAKSMSDINNLHAHNIEIDTENEELQKQLQQAHYSKDEITTAIIQEKSKIIESLENQVSLQSKDIDSLNNSLNQNKILVNELETSKIQLINEQTKLNMKIEELNNIIDGQKDSIKELKNIIDFLENSIKQLKNLQTKVIKSFPNIQSSLDKKEVGYKKIYTDINEIKEYLYEPLKQLSTISTSDTNKHSIESMLLKFETIKESISNQIADASKDKKLFTLVENELVETMSTIDECTQNESAIEGCIASLRDELSVLKNQEVEQECLLDALLFAYSNHVDNVNRSLEYNRDVVKGLTNAGILVQDAQLVKELNAVTVEGLKSDNVWILRRVKQVIFEHIMLLDKQIIYKNFDDINR